MNHYECGQVYYRITYRSAWKGGGGKRRRGDDWKKCRRDGTICFERNERRKSILFGWRAKAQAIQTNRCHNRPIRPTWKLTVNLVARACNTDTPRNLTVFISYPWWNSVKKPPLLADNMRDCRFRVAIVRRWEKRMQGSGSSLRKNSGWKGSCWKKKRQQWIE